MQAALRPVRRWRFASGTRPVRRATRSIHDLARIGSALIDAHRFEEADEICEIGLSVLPHDADLLEKYAYSAHNSGRFAEAMERWSILRDLRPGRPMGWCGVACNARELGQLNKAEQVMIEALRRFPNDYIIISEAARLYDRLGAYAKAIGFWRRMVDRPPVPVIADWLWAHATVAIRLGFYDEAEASLIRIIEGSETHRSERPRHVVADAWCDTTGRIEKIVDQQRSYDEGIERFPDNIRVLGSAARLAEVVNDPKKAGKLYRRLMQLEPNDLDWRAGYVRTLINLDLVDDAEREIKEGLLRVPNHEDLTHSWGLVAMRRQNWDEALPILSAHAKAHPEDDLARDRTERIQRLRHLDKAAAHEVRATTVGPLAVGFTDDPAVRQLLLNFESMGIDCEFGAVQRHYGAEPLGLLRWNDTDYPTLSAALSANFAGMGEPQYTELIVGNAQEIDLRDKRWNLRMHTFMRDDEISKEALLPKMQKRVAFLREKMLDDLRAGEKIFVYKDDHIGIKELYYLHDLLQNFGRNSLLYVQKAGRAKGGGVPTADVGEVIELRPNLYVGHIDRIHDLHNIAFAGWADVCKSTAAMRARPSETEVLQGRSSAPFRHDQNAARVDSPSTN